MELDEVIAFTSLRSDLALHFVYCVYARLVNESSRGIDGRTNQLSALNPSSPFQLDWRAAEVENRGDTVRQIQRGIPKI